MVFLFSLLLFQHGTDATKLFPPSDVPGYIVGQPVLAAKCKDSLDPCHDIDVGQDLILNVDSKPHPVLFGVRQRYIIKKDPSRQETVDNWFIFDNNASFVQAYSNSPRTKFEDFVRISTDSANCTSNPCVGLRFLFLIV